MATQTPEEVRRAARDILDNPEFVRPESTFWSDVARAILDPVGTISRFLDWLFAGTAGVPGGAWTAWVIVAIAAALLIFTVVRITQSMVRDDATTLQLAPDAGSVSWRELRQQAEDAERDGDWRRALRLRYASLVDQLDESGVLQRRPGRTTGEYARQVKANAPDASPSFGEATSIFNFVWYGDGQANEEVVSRFKNLADASARMVDA